MNYPKLNSKRKKLIKSMKNGVGRYNIYTAGIPERGEREWGRSNLWKTKS